MNNLNSVLLEGQLVHNPQAKTAPNGNMVCIFTLATERRFVRKHQEQRDVSYFEVEVSNRCAELCAAVLEKDSGVRVVGRLREMTWVDEGGQSHSRLWIVGEQVQRKALKPLVLGSSE